MSVNELDQYMYPRSSSLTVSEVERLAKAGVKIEFKDIAQQVISDPIPPTPTHVHHMRHYPLIESFYERWRRANPMARDTFIEQFGVFAVEEGEKVIVLVSDGSRHAVIEDTAILYPSDALMAAVHLWKKTL